jgi:hypothetical protein
MVTVLRPDVPLAITADHLAVPIARPPITESVRLGLVANGKPKAESLLRYVAEGIRERLPIAEVELHMKNSAGKVVDPDRAKVMAARCHLIVTGLGD